ncbi:glycosyltransferase family 9 protein [Pelagibacteraceae bacterium]|nr:glycosyltransferase family 9 protein [Pelagibacteraceae bacterium]
MSNILIIKHGSLGDIAQISGVIKDIKENNKSHNLIILTTFQYVELLSKCPYLDAVLIDKRLPRWNILYLIKLKKMLLKFNFLHVYDLQNSSRTSFYRKFLLNNLNWCSSETILEKNEKKKDFDEESVLERFQIQLSRCKLKTLYTLKPDFSWACQNVDKIVNKYFGKKFILLFPFCSAQHPQKKWPYFNNLIKIIKEKHPNLEVAIAPGPNELHDAKNINAIIIKNNEKSLSIMELSGLIKKAEFIICNDTGPAHIAAHLGKNGVVIFGHHTTPKRVSIETEKFKAITSRNLKNLDSEKVYNEIRNKLELVN